MKVNVFRNKEAKALLIKLLILQGIIIMAIFFCIGINKRIVLEGVINSKAQIIGTILENHPELEAELLYSFRDEADENVAQKGKELLAKYGYDINMDYALEPILGDVWKSNLIIFACFGVILLLISAVIIYLELKKTYGKVNEAYTYVDDILKGEKATTLDYEGEGEFPILANEINKMVSVIKKDNEIINREKEYLKEILADISHQLKTPLTSITMLTDILIQKNNMDRQKQVEFLNKIYTQSEKMEWLIYNLLKIARLDAGSTEFEHKKVSLDTVINASIGLLEPKIMDKNIKLNIKGEDTYFIGDKEWSTEAITNILKNAIEHSFKDGEIEITKEDNAVFSRLIIRDNGEGISKKDLPNIFKRFYTGSKGSKPDSIGIGLAMAKSIIERQNGDILVKSKEGNGTEFKITFIKDSKV